MTIPNDLHSLYTRVVTAVPESGVEGLTWYIYDNDWGAHGQIIGIDAAAALVFWKWMRMLWDANGPHMAKCIGSKGEVAYIVVTARTFEDEASSKVHPDPLTALGEWLVGNAKERKQ